MTRRIYIDGIFDLFHMGHVLHLKDVKQLDNKDNYLIVGIISDKDAENYKRNPVYDENNRKILVESCKYVNEVMLNPPLVITEDFIQNNRIDLICHGFLDNNDIEKQKDFFEIPIKLNKFRAVKYHNDISTTDIINKIKYNY